MSAFKRLRHRVRGQWASLTSSLWFIPSAMVGVSVLLALLLVELSAQIGARALAEFPRVFGAGAAGARGMLSTIAGSVITVAGVTFSITIAALAQASAQYTPRVLRTFMGDRANQIVLGTFVGVYSYCLVVLRTIRGGDEGAFVPSIAVLGGFLLALVSVGVLIFFIHHIAAALQASTILDRVRRATEGAIADLFPGNLARALDDGLEASVAMLDGAAWHAVASVKTGYVQSVDTDGLVAFAREHALVVRMERAVGDFVAAGAPLVAVTPSPRPARTPSADVRDATRSLNALFTINAHRTIEQDAGFGILQIVDIALKALSPGINDTTTAVTCVDHLGALLACLARRHMPGRARGEKGELRVIATGPTFAGLVSLAFADIRRNATGNVTVLWRVLDAIETIARFTDDAGCRRVLLEQVDLLEEAANAEVKAASDRAAFATRVRDARSSLDAA